MSYTKGQNGYSVTKRICELKEQFAKQGYSKGLANKLECLLADLPPIDSGVYSKELEESLDDFSRVMLYAHCGQHVEFVDKRKAIALPLGIIQDGRQLLEIDDRGDAFQQVRIWSSPLFFTPAET